MHRSFFYLVIIISITFQGLCEEPDTQKSEQAVRQVVAEVNGESITKEQLDKELRASLREDIESFKVEQRHVLLRTMLEKMVERQLLLQQASNLKLVPGDAAIDKFIGSLNSQLPEKNQFKHQLKKFGVDEQQYRERLREELGIKEYLDRKVFKTLAVSEEEIRLEFKANAEKYGEPKQICARHIFVRVPEASSEEVTTEILARATKIRKLLDNEENDFATLARRYSEANNRGKGGNLGCFTENQLPKPFAEAAFKLNAGEISQVVRTKQGFHIIKADSFKGGGIPKFEEARDRIEAKLLRVKRSKLLEDHLNTLKKEGKVILYYN